MEGNAMMTFTNFLIQRYNIDFFQARKEFNKLHHGIFAPTDILPSQLFDVALLEFGYSPEMIISKSRIRRIVIIRQTMMYLLWKHQYGTLRAIGNLFGNRNHATIIHARETIEDLIETNDKEAMPIISRLIEAVKTN